MYICIRIYIHIYIYMYIYIYMVDKSLLNPLSFEVAPSFLVQRIAQRLLSWPSWRPMPSQCWPRAPKRARAYYLGPSPSGQAQVAFEAKAKQALDRKHRLAVPATPHTMF